MCGPLAVLGAGLQIAGQVAGFAAQNQQSKQNAINASLAAQRKYEDTDRKFIYDTKAANQEGYKAIMEGREARGTAIASAGSSGVRVGSPTSAYILSNINSKIAQIEDNVRLKAEDRRMARSGDMKSIEAEAKNRIASVPRPNPLALGLNIANIGFKAYQGQLA